MDCNIYVENILDHYHNPRNFGKPEKFDIYRNEFNPLCGDKISVFIKLNKNIIEDIKFTGNGCAISQAAASILTEHIKGKDIEEIKQYGEHQIMELLGIKISHLRLKCALLSIKTIQNALNQ